MLKSIDNIGIAVSDLITSFKFYESLGFIKTWENEKSCMIQHESVILFLFQTDNIISPKPERKIPDLFNNPVGIDYIAFQSDNVDRFYQEIKAKGIQFILEPIDQEWGARMAAAKDPDGNVLYFIQRVN